ncbi:teichoic acid D-Ala incorporation-associated protein DltX [Lentilactobacillus rapi]|uniref:teichoic acid D-Ala incorporation-associated protein DltX n=1 Tax=Lentilactobacillus rapi TaxID=481723 RepID=UPI0006D0CD99|nr:teichoic acid D-Ala incorporation-associated protein DltX [Lentilactobacillus rapi]
MITWHLKKWLEKPVVRFLLNTLIYFAIMLVLFYLYDYSGINQAKFIYNDF